MEQLSFDKDVIEAVTQSSHRLYDSIQTLEELSKDPEALEEISFLRDELMDLMSAFE